MTPSEIADGLARNAQDMRGEEYFRTADLLDQAAAKIRAQAEALKIATEALERIVASCPAVCELSAASAMADDATQALARIKEV